MDWFVIAWIASTLLVILYALRKIERAERHKRAAEVLDAALMSKSLAQINEPIERERNEQLRREGKIW